MIVNSTVQACYLVLTNGANNMAKLSKTKQNDAFMVAMFNKGFETIFIQELPHPSTTRNCAYILARVGNLIHIRSMA